MSAISDKIEAYHNKQITLDELTQFLVDFKFKVPQHIQDAPEDPNQLFAFLDEQNYEQDDTWDEVSALFNLGWLSADDYHHIQDAVYQAHTGDDGESGPDAPQEPPSDDSDKAQRRYLWRSEDIQSLMSKAKHDVSKEKRGKGGQWTAGAGDSKTVDDDPMPDTGGFMNAEQHAVADAALLAWKKRHNVPVVEWHDPKLDTTEPLEFSGVDGAYQLFSDKTGGPMGPQAKWKDSIGEEGRKAFKSYCGTPQSWEMNNFLRGNIGENALLPQQHKSIAELTRALSTASLPVPMKVYRAIPSIDEGEIESWEPGREFVDGGFVSATVAKGYAETWISSRKGPSAYGNASAIVSYVLPKGSPAAFVDFDMTVGGSEGEVLAQRGARFRVVSVKKAEHSNADYELELEYLGSNGNGGEMKRKRKSLAEEKSGTSRGALLGWIVRRQRKFQDMLQHATQNRDARAILRAQQGLAQWTRLRQQAEAVLNDPTLGFKAQHDVSKERRNESGQWTAGGAVDAILGSTSKIELKKLPADERVWQGRTDPGQTALSKNARLTLGSKGEEVAAQSLGHLLKANFRNMNDHIGGNSPLDLVGDTSAVEVKAGRTSNGPSARHWRITMGEPGDADKLKMSKMSPDELREYNHEKTAYLVQRKTELADEEGKKVGRKLKPTTVGVIFTPGMDRADVYVIPGFHPILPWSKYATDQYYAGTVEMKRRSILEVGE